MENDYKKIIESFGKLGTLKEHHNQLNKVLVATEDYELRKRLRIFIDRISTIMADAKLKIKSTDDIRLKDCVEFRPLMKPLLSYCGDILSTQKPQWQILAERHGWSKVS